MKFACIGACRSKRHPSAWMMLFSREYGVSIRSQPVDKRKSFDGLVVCANVSSARILPTVGESVCFHQPMYCPD